ncbi:MAG TPA: single-stranded DNA-binding protein [Firmicutes bacterium]|nr:single-stranded DNA-binding protein [Bacillota bacterium]
MLNKVILIGRLTRDPEVRYTQSGKAVTTFDLAVDRSVANAQGQRETDFIPIVTWGKLAETCGNYLNKGRLVAVDGRLQIRSYETQDGQKRRVAEVVADGVRFLDRGKEPANAAGAGTGAGAGATGDVFPDDDIPF